MAMRDYAIINIFKYTIHVYKHMVKTLTISQEAYERLASRKEPGESFTDVIKKLTGKSDLMDLAGVLSDAEAEALREGIKTRRAELRSRMLRSSKKL